jgi:alpha-tubulin suppressor-like RCC1 family protein
MTPVSQPAHNPIKQISAGTRHSLAVAESGHAYSWGLGRELRPCLPHGKS